MYTVLFQCRPFHQNEMDFSSSNHFFLYLSVTFIVNLQYFTWIFPTMIFAWGMPSQCPNIYVNTLVITVLPFRHLLAKYRPIKHLQYNIKKLNGETPITWKGNNFIIGGIVTDMGMIHVMQYTLILKERLERYTTALYILCKKTICAFCFVWNLNV